MTSRSVPPLGVRELLEAVGALQREGKLDPELSERLALYAPMMPPTLGPSIALWCPFCLARVDGGKRLVIFAIAFSGGAFHERGRECPEWCAHETAYSFVEAMRDRIRATVQA